MSKSLSEIYTIAIKTQLLEIVETRPSNSNINKEIVSTLIHHHHHHRENRSRILQEHPASDGRKNRKRSIRISKSQLQFSKCRKSKPRNSTRKRSYSTKTHEPDNTTQKNSYDVLLPKILRLEFAPLSTRSG